MNENEWYKVDELVKNAKDRYKEYDNGEIDNTNDCDSYRLLYEGQENTNIESHNSLGVAADTISACISFTIRKYAKTAKKLADLGGGCGFIASAIKKKNSELDIYSYDLQKYASLYGQKNFPNIKFICKAINPDDIFDEGKFDVILAYEFYPFTRNSEVLYQKSYVDMCLNNLNDNGILLIEAPITKESNNILNIENEMRKSYNVLDKIIMPYPKIHKLCKNYFMANIVSRIFALFRTSKQCLLVVKK